MAEKINTKIIIHASPEVEPISKTRSVMSALSQLFSMRKNHAPLEVSKLNLPANENTVQISQSAMGIEFGFNHNLFLFFWVARIIASWPKSRITEVRCVNKTNAEIMPYAYASFLLLLSVKKIR